MQGISASGSVVVSGNTVYGQTGNGTGIALSGGAQASDNTVYGNGTGISVSEGGLISDNQVYANTVVGITASFGLTTIQGNQVYANAVGVDLATEFSGTVANNVLEGNTTAGIHDQTGSFGGTQELVNNTIDAETGNAVQVDGNTANAQLLNNILWAQAGYDISVAADSQVGFQSDYNDLYTTGTGSLGWWQGVTFTSLATWYYELGLDEHSITADPQFVNPSGPEGSFDFHLLPSSPAVAAGDPDSYYFQEPAPNGGRIDLGAYGNTPQATPSPAQVVQVLSPGAVDKVQVSQQVTVTWQTAGLTALAPVALIDAGGTGVDNFGPDQFQTSAGSTDNSFTSAVDTSGVVAPAPQAVYQSYAEAAYGVGNALSYHLAVPDGTYTIRLDFAEPDQSEPAGGRVFDIDLQGATVQAGYDIVAAAGGALTATATSYTVTASGGEGINLSLVNDTATPAVLSGIEVFAANAGGVANPTVDLQVSPDGGATLVDDCDGTDDGPVRPRELYLDDPGDAPGRATSTSSG